MPVHAIGHLLPDSDWRPNTSPLFVLRQQIAWPFHSVCSHAPLSRNGKPEEGNWPTRKGRRAQTSTGPFFTYTPVENKIMFATAVLNQRIQALQPRAGDRCRFTYSRTSNGVYSEWIRRRASQGLRPPGWPATGCHEPLPERTAGKS